MSQRKHSVTLSASAYKYCLSLVENDLFESPDDAASYLITQAKVQGSTGIANTPIQPIEPKTIPELPKAESKTAVPQSTNPVLPSTSPMMTGGISALRSAKSS